MVRRVSLLLGDIYGLMRPRKYRRVKAMSLGGNLELFEYCTAMVKILYRGRCLRHCRSGSPQFLISNLLFG